MDDGFEHFLANCATSDMGGVEASDRASDKNERGCVQVDHVMFDGFVDEQPLISIEVCSTLNDTPLATRLPEAPLIDGEHVVILIGDVPNNFPVEPDGRAKAMDIETDGLSFRWVGCWKPKCRQFRLVLAELSH